MHTSPNQRPLSAPTGSAKSFVAARRRRRQEGQVAPKLRWERLVAPASGSELHTDGTFVWVLRLVGDGGSAEDAQVVLFSSDTVVRTQAGESGRVEAGDRWDFTLDEIDVLPPRAIWGYALARGGDGRWFASTIDGRSASFRSRPDELGVLQTLGLRLPLAAAPHDGEVRCGRAPSEHPQP